MESAPKGILLPVVKGGCCCDLTTCCRVQGWLSLISSPIALILSISSIVTKVQTCEERQQPGLACFMEQHPIIDILNIILDILLIFATIRFLQGIGKGEPGKMLPYIRLTVVQILMLFIYLVLITIAGRTAEALVGGFVICLCIGLLFYCLICAKSLYTLMVTNGAYGLMDSVQMP